MSVIAAVLVAGCGDNAPPIGATDAAASADASISDAAPTDAAATDAALADAATTDAATIDAATDDAHNSGTPDAHNSGTPDAHNSGTPDAHLSSPDAGIGVLALTPTATALAPEDFGSIPNDGSFSQTETITLTNNTATTAFNIGLDFKHGITSSLYSLVSDSCNANLNAGSFCQIHIKFGSASSNDPIGAATGTFVVTYNAVQNGPQLELDYPMTGTVTGTSTQTTTVVASLSLTQTTNVASGAGTANSPFNIFEGEPATITITYAVTNTSAEADNFTVDGPSGAIGVGEVPWSVSANTCQSATLKSGTSTCSVTFALSNIDGFDEDDIDITDNFTITWMDNQGSESGDGGIDFIFAFIAQD